MGIHIYKNNYTTLYVPNPKHLQQSFLKISLTSDEEATNFVDFSLGLRVGCEIYVKFTQLLQILYYQHLAGDFPGQKKNS